MTIVAKNSLTISNVNDGTITHYAYAYSADGTDRFTTVYPNLNLLTNSRLQSGSIAPFSSVNNAVLTINSNVKGLNVSCSGGTIGYQQGIGQARMPASAGNQYTISVKVINTGTVAIDKFVLQFGFYNSAGTGIAYPNKNFSIPADGKVYSLSYTVTTTADTTAIRYYCLDIATLANVAHTFTIYDMKAELGSIATPWMPSASEVTTADWPKYIGHYTDFMQADSTNPSDYTWGPMRGDDGKDGADGKDGIAGKDGVGIKTTVITYAISTNGATAPATGWTSSVPGLVKGQYLWTKTVWTYTDNSSETGYTVSYISKDGNNGTDGLAGKDGVGIKTTTITYAGSTSGTTAPTSGWTTTVPTVAAGSYLWTKTVWTYTDNTSETGYSVAKMGNTGPVGPPGSNGNPGKIVSDTEPTAKFKGLTWKYSGMTAINASDGTSIQPSTEYYWNGNNWVLNQINAHNINVDDLSAISTTLTNGKFISNWSSDNASGTTTIEKNHFIINSANASLNTENTIALDNEQGMMMTYNNKTNKQTVSAGVNFQGLFVTDSTGPYAKVTPTGVVTSVDVPWTSIGTYADYKRDGNVVTIRVVDAVTTTAGNITLGRIPSKDGPVEAVMGPAIAWSSANTNDKHLQINEASGGAIVTILNAVANQKYKFQFSYQI